MGFFAESVFFIFLGLNFLSAAWFVVGYVIKIEYRHSTLSIVARIYVLDHNNGQCINETLLEKVFFFSVNVFFARMKAQMTKIQLLQPKLQFGQPRFRHTTLSPTSTPKFAR